MDEMDVKILRVLDADGRASVQKVADKVGLRRPSVHARIERLEAEGIVEGYHARIAPAAIGAGLVALVFLRVSHGRGSDCMAACGKVGDALARIPEVVEFHTLAGEDDAVAKVRVADMRHLERVVMKQISGVAGVERVRTSVVLSTHLERRPAILARAPAETSSAPSTSKS